MKIIIMRHGRPVFSPPFLIAPTAMKGWIDTYDRAVVVPGSAPEACRRLAGSATCFVSSTIPRALSSLQELGYSPSIVDRVFCEVELPFTRWRFPTAPSACWVALFRALWLFGVSPNAEPLREARRRAAIAASRLATAADKETTLLMGHAIMNRLITGHLRRDGWSGRVHSGRRYWSVSVLERW